MFKKCCGCRGSPVLDREEGSRHSAGDGKAIVVEDGEANPMEGDDCKGKVGIVRSNDDSGRELNECVGKTIDSGGVGGANEGPCKTVDDGDGGSNEGAGKTANNIVCGANEGAGEGIDSGISGANDGAGKTIDNGGVEANEGAGKTTDSVVCGANEGAGEEIDSGICGAIEGAGKTIDNGGVGVNEGAAKTNDSVVCGANEGAGKATRNGGGEANNFNGDRSTEQKKGDVKGGVLKRRKEKGRAVGSDLHVNLVKAHADRDKPAEDTDDGEDCREDDEDEEGDGVPEYGGMTEPPVTPVGRDELALRRHRFFTDLMAASQEMHRVRFDPRGPSFSGESEEGLLGKHTSELKSLVTRLETVTTKLEETIAVAQQFRSSPLPRYYSTSPTPSPLPAMSIQGYKDIIQGPLTSYIQLSEKIGSHVAAHAKLVKEAFEAQLVFLEIANSREEPGQAEQVNLLRPTSAKIQAVQELREKNRPSPHFNHLSAISESIPALGWVTVKPAPAPYVKEMSDAGQFYTNRVLKDWKEKDKTHVDWVKAWLETLGELQKYVKQEHTTGLTWVRGSSGATVPPPPPGGLPPPPPPIGDLSLDSAGDQSNDRSALFAEINQGENITRNLKKVTSEMQTHKNAGLRTGPAPFKAPALTSPVSVTAPKTPPKPADKPPKFLREGKKWLIEHQKGNHSLLVDGAEMNNVVYMYGCSDSTLTVKGKINSVFLDSCRKTSVLFDTLVSSIEFVNCQSVQMQVLGKVPTISIDKTDGCQMYLNWDTLEVEIISSKSSEMNVLIPKPNGDYAEYPIAEQFKTTVNKTGLSTAPVENKG